MVLEGTDPTHNPVDNAVDDGSNGGIVNVFPRRKQEIDHLLPSQVLQIGEDILTDVPKPRGFHLLCIVLQDLAMDSRAIDVDEIDVLHAVSQSNIRMAYVLRQQRPVFRFERRLDQFMREP